MTTRTTSSPARLLPLLTAAEIREWERAAFAEQDVDERVVLESAGRAAASAVAMRFPEGRVIGVIGRGRNGGDATVALRTLKAWGREVTAVPVGGAQVAPELVHGWELETAPPEPATFAAAAVILDGILGTGATGAPREAAARAIDAINSAGRPVVALDGPTGVDLTTGAVPGVAIAATLTVTFGALKRGLLLYPGRELAGEILLAEIGLPPFQAETGSAAAITPGWARAHLPRIAPDAHKGSVGLVGIVAGRTGVGGAAIMAAMGALRAGAGGVRIVSTDSNRVAIHAAVPEAVFLDRDSEELEDGLGGVDSLLIGPGIGLDPSARHLLVRLLRLEVPILLDADALTLLAADRRLLPPEAAPRCVLTPHPGELGRLVGRSTAEVLIDRFASAAEATGTFGCVVLAKGAPSLVASPGTPTLVATTGHSGVATGGMGDTLAGIVSSLLAMGAPPREAAAVGLHFAGRAAEMAGRGRGLLPRDVAEALPVAMADGGVRERRVEMGLFRRIGGAGGPS